jgi:hypothetical protein
MNLSAIPGDDAKTVDDARAVPASVLVCGMMRSGSTLLCDLLSLPGRSYVMSEPMIFSGWDTVRYEEIRAAATRLQVELPALPDEAARAGAPPLQFFREQVEPALAALDLWGMKEVMLDTWRPLVAYRDFDHLLVPVRDLRDVALSAIDLVRGAYLAFPGGRRMRDEAWLVTRLAHDAHEIGQLTERRHRLIRYEDLTTRQEVRERLADELGLGQLGTSNVSRETTTGGQRRREVESMGTPPHRWRLHGIAASRRARPVLWPTTPGACRRVIASASGMTSRSPSPYPGRRAWPAAHQDTPPPGRSCRMGIGSAHGGSIHGSPGAGRASWRAPTSRRARGSWTSAACCRPCGSCWRAAAPTWASI